jgi:hypothetical protein
VTVSTNVVLNFTRDQLLTAAIRKTGILEASQIPDSAMLANAAVNLELVIKSLQAEDVNLGTIERATPMALTAATASYSLPSDTIDITIGQSDNLGTLVRADGSESIIKTMSRDEWLQLAVKTQSGPPTRGYLEKGPTCTITFWPVPDVSTYTFRYTKVRLFKSGGTGANTMDSRGFWAEYFVYAVAEGVAYDNSLFGRAKELGAKGEKLRARCLTGEAQHGKIRWRVAQRGRNW